jgi:hypothetical protein
MQEFFAANGINSPDEVPPPQNPSDDKFMALKNMMVSTLDKIQAQVGNIWVKWTDNSEGIHTGQFASRENEKRRESQCHLGEIDRRQQSFQADMMWLYTIAVN